jgi:beta-lactamase class A
VNGLRTVACIRRLDDDHETTEGADDIVPLASVGKILLLGEVARRLVDRSLSAAERLPMLAEDRSLGGTGLLASLSPTSWPVQDLVTAVAAVSDNAATNVLLRAVSLEAVQELGRGCGMVHTTVHDQIRRRRGPGMPPQFASGTVRELAAFLRDVALDRFVSPETSSLLRSWLRLNVDRSLVADAVAHEEDRLDVANKTGTDEGVRADVGIVTGHRVVVYAVVTTCAPGSEGAAVGELRRWGGLIRRLALEPAGVPGPSTAEPGHRRPISPESSAAARRSSSTN